MTAILNINAYGELIRQHKNIKKQRIEGNFQGRSKNTSMGISFRLLIVCKLKRSNNFISSWRLVGVEGWQGTSVVW